MREIKVNDLVIVVRWPHRHSLGWFDKAPGTPFIVTSVFDCCYCSQCGQSFDLGAATGAQINGCAGAVPLAWLKKIEPDARLDAQPTHKELHV